MYHIIDKFAPQSQYIHTNKNNIGVASINQANYPNRNIGRTICRNNDSVIK